MGTFLEIQYSSINKLGKIFMKDLLTIIVKVRAKENFENALVEEQMKLAAVSKKSPGCIRYELHRSNSEAGLIFFVEEWESRHFWQMHMASDYIAAFQNLTVGFIESVDLHELHKIL